MTPEECQRCGRVAVLVDWPLGRRRIFGFGQAAVWAMGWRACPACVAFVRSVVESIPPADAP